SDVPDSTRACRGAKLMLDEISQIFRVERIPDLMTGPVEAQIGQRLVRCPGTEPKGEDALLGGTELPGSREDAASVDRDRQGERVAVGDRHHLGRDLRGAVDRDGAGGR